MEWPVLDSSQTNARSLIHEGVSSCLSLASLEPDNENSRASMVRSTIPNDFGPRLPFTNSSGVRRSSRVSRLQDQSQIFYETTAAGSVSELAVLQSFPLINRHLLVFEAREVHRLTS